MLQQTVPSVKESVGYCACVSCYTNGNSLLEPYSSVRLVKSPLRNQDRHIIHVTTDSTLSEGVRSVRCLCLMLS